MDKMQTAELLAPRGQDGNCMLPRKASTQECGGRCEGCGWCREEYISRRAIPLTLCKDGLRRKILPPRPRTDELGN